MKSNISNHVQVDIFLTIFACICMGIHSEIFPVKIGCPLVCVCLNNQGTVYVDCKSIWITKIPDIGLNASKISIMGGDIKVIPKFAFRGTNYNSITSLRLINNNIENLNNGCFRGVENTQFLSLSGNKIAHVNGKILQSLQKIHRLSFAKNKLTSFDSFCVLKSLQILTISDNNLTNARFALCYRNATSLRTINLSGNQISEISRQDFKNLEDIKIAELYFSRCKLTQVSKDAFDYLPYLKSLDLSFNQLKQLHQDLFLKPKYISKLLISNNQFHKSPDDAIGSLTHLKELHIGGNDLITNFKVGPVFKNFTKLTKLNLKSQNLIHLTNSTFEHLSSCPLNELIISECSIRSVEANAFFPLLPKLQKLNIGYNPLNATELKSALYSLRETRFKNIDFNGFQLKDLDNSTFKYLDKNITFLTIVNSEITTIRKGVFSHFKDLKTLHLTNNDISTIADNSFRNLTQLVTLYLDDNYLYRVPSSTRGQLPSNLHYLNLNGNNFKSLQSSAFLGLHHLRILFLRKANIQKISKGCWQPLISLEYLNLRENQLTKLSSFSGRLPSNLRELYVANNAIENFEEADFSSLTNLRVLDLSNQRQRGSNPSISSIIKRLVSPLIRLQTLNIGTLVLKTLEIDTFQNNSNLINLDLENNRFNSWDPQLFKPLQKLQFLRLSQNGIFYVDKLSFSYLHSLRRIDLSKNPFYCNCDLVWFRNKFLYQENVFVGGLDDKKSYICEAPSNLAGTPLLEFQITSKDCAHVAIRRLTVFILFSFVAVTSVISAVFRYRWYIRYWVYIRAKRNPQIHDVGDILYDAYVSYHAKDLKWVIQKLLPALEYNGEFKLCLEDRDWGVGEMFIDCVQESIEKSRKTILILSDNYAKCRRCQQVLALAHHRYLDDNIDVLVPILLSDIQAKNLTAGISALLTQKIYIEWPRDKNKENQFWKGLKSALKKTQRGTYPVMKRRRKLQLRRNKVTPV